MFRVASFRTFLQILLVSTLAVVASSAVAQDKPKDEPQDQPKATEKSGQPAPMRSIP